MKERPGHTLQCIFELFAQVSQSLEKARFAVIIMIYLDGQVKRIRHLIGAHDLKRDFMVTGELDLCPVFPGAREKL
jgi:hypothetical protein